MVFIRHFWRLMRDLATYCWWQEVIWPLPVLLLLLLAALAAVSSAAVAPYIYTLF